MFSKSHEEEDQFLGDEPATEIHPPYHRRSLIRDRVPYILQILLVINAILLLAVLFQWQNIQSHVCDKRTVKDIYSPAQSALEYHIQSIDTRPPTNPFTGEPRRELDEAWSTLLHGTTVRIHEQEMKDMNRTSIRLKDGSGYAGYVEVYHMLHCVKRMYQTVNRDHYQDLADSGHLSIDHFNHCVEVLRRGIMCNADLTVNTYSWDPSARVGIRGHTLYPRKCANWDNIMEWAEERALGSDFAEKLVPDGEPDSMGPSDLLPRDLHVEDKARWRS